MDVRLAALECLSDFVRVEGSWSDLEHLINLIETDPSPFIRHKLIRILVRELSTKLAHSVTKIYLDLYL